MDQPVVLISRENSIYGGAILEKALQSQLNITGVIIQDWKKKQKIKRFQYYVRNYGFFTIVFSKAIESIDSFFFARSELKTGLSVNEVAKLSNVQIYSVPTLNGKESLSYLKMLAPEVILLAGVGIVSEKLISCAKIGVINSHPGIVPKYKGSYVIRWGLLAHDPIGITVHIVDSGIDTGRVLAIHKVDLPRTHSIIAIERHMDMLRAGFLVSDTESFLKHNLIPQIKSTDNGCSPYSLMPPRQLIQTYRSLFRS